MKNIYLNNKETFLNVALPSAATSLPVASLNADIVGVTLVDGEQVMLTLGEGATSEIVKVTAYPTLGSSYALQRAQEGTSALTWPIGAKVAARFTAGMATRYPQNFYDGVDSFAFDVQTIQKKVLAAFRLGSNRADNAAVAIGDVKLSVTTAYVYLRDGTTGASEPGLVDGEIGMDGTAVALKLAIDSEGRIETASSSFGKFTVSVQGATAIGGEAFPADPFSSIATQNQAVAVNGMATGSNSTAINQGRALATGSTAIGEVANKIDESVAFHAPSTKSTFLLTNKSQANMESVIWSPVVSFSGGTTWAANTNYKQGDVVKPTTPNGFQYVRQDQLYTFATYGDAGYVGGLSGATEPVWETTAFSTNADGDGEWVAFPNAAVPTNLAADFLVSQIGIVLFDAAAVTAQPSVSFGYTGNASAFRANAATSGLTAAKKIQLFTPTGNDLAHTQMLVGINTLATATKMVGQVFFKGFYCPPWY